MFRRLTASLSLALLAAAALTGCCGTKCIKDPPCCKKPETPK